MFLKTLKLVCFICQNPVYEGVSLAKIPKVYYFHFNWRLNYKAELDRPSIGLPSLQALEGPRTLSLGRRGTK